MTHHISSSQAAAAGSERIQRLIGPSGRERLRRKPYAQEEVVEYLDRIRDVHGPISVRISPKEDTGAGADIDVLRSRGGVELPGGARHPQHHGVFPWLKVRVNWI